MKSIPNKTPGSKLFADDWNNLSSESQNAITDTGQTLTGSDLFQFSKSISNYASHGDFYNEVGAVNAYVLSPISSKKAPTAYAEGFRARFITANTNTGATTININSLGVKAIVDSNNHSLNGGEIQANKIITIAYDGTKFILMDSSTLLAYKHLTKNIEGLTISNNISDPAHDINIAPGTFEDAYTTQLAFSLYTSIIKQIDANWAQGTNAGGFPSALTLSPNTWYHVFAIAKADGTVDAGFDTLIVPANLAGDIIPAGFLYARRIGSVLTDGSANISLFFQFGNKFIWDTPKLDAGSVPASFASVTLSTPLGINTEAQILVGATASGGGGLNIVTKQVFQSAGLNILTMLTNDLAEQLFTIITDQASTIEHQYTGTAPASYAIETLGWTEIDF